MAAGVEIGVEEHGYSLEFLVSSLWFRVSSLLRGVRRFLVKNVAKAEVLHGYAGSFDFVRLSPHCAQYDKLKNTGDQESPEGKTESPVPGGPEMG
jgi:hypothetical protein